MKRFQIILSSFLLVLNVHAAWGQPTDQANSRHQLSGIGTPHLRLLKAHCQPCHEEANAEGKFRIDHLSLVVTDSPAAERWQKVLNVLNAGEMPPKDAPQLPASQKADLVDDLARAMVDLRNKMSDRHGEIAMSRLNRREYRNTLRALLGVQIDVSQLPPDNGLGNFDTNGASLYVSSNQIASYLELGREALEEAIDRFYARDVQIGHRHEAELLTQRYKTHFSRATAANRWLDDLKAAGMKPENAKIYEQVKKKDPRRLPFYLFYDQIAGAPAFPDAKHNFYDNPERIYRFAAESANPHRAYLSRYLDLPAIESGAFITVPTIHPSHVPSGHITYRLPPGWPPGKYKVRFRVGRADDAPPERRFLEFGVRVRNVDLLSTHEVKGTLDQPEVIETVVEMTRKHTPGENHDGRELFIREKGMHHQFHYPRRVFHEAKRRNGYGPEYVFWIDWLEVERVLSDAEPLAPGMQVVSDLLGDEETDNQVVHDFTVRKIRNVTGRTVRVFNPDSGGSDFLHLREVQVFSDGKNIATAGSATQSSTHGSEKDRGPHLAIDGNLSTFNHTSNITSPGEWWQVDLGQDAAIEKIVLYNRNDSSGVIPRLKNYTIEILDAQSNVVWGQAKEFSAEELKRTFADFSMVAFRGQRPTDRFLNRLVQRYQRTKEKKGETHRSALTHALAIVLSSPMFLYKAESSLQQTQRVTQRELAQRLSYFLWSQPADATLIRLADSGELADPKVLSQQTERLLDDPRSKEMIQAFVDQWLDLERLDFFNVNVVKFRTFDVAVKKSVRREIYETFHYVMDQNRSIGELLASDYVVIDNVLAQYYGIPGISGDTFRRVDLPSSSPRGGLLGMAAVHLMGGNGEESSPVERGAWVLRKLLDQPPPPAPANVPAISRFSNQKLTTRERLRAHQEQPQCASCHRKIDPIGLGLENFDAVGLWRTEIHYPSENESKPAEETWTIEPSGKLYGGAAFRDYFELREMIAGHRDAFARSFTSALVEYGMGRSIGFSDQQLIEDVASLAAKQDYRIRAFIHAFVQTDVFQLK